ncbi:MAG: DUF2806 domain-containing protein [Magnetovibrio sp.]|nr:DUF2806 domain-containing protein [Magnetovibrio sp.]
MSDSDDGKDPSETARRIAESMGRLLGGDYAPLGGDEGDEGGMRDRLNHRLVALEMRRQRNIEAVAAAAFEAAGYRPEGDDAAVIDEDWMVRLIDHVQDIGNPLMQEIWGQVLAREAREPGTFSVQALDGLAKMTADDLDTWKRAGRLIFPTGYLLKIGTRLEFDDFGLTDRDVVRLQALGLLQEPEDLSVTFYAPTKGLTFDFEGADLVVRHPESTLFTFPAFKLTAIGNELYGPLARGAVDTDYLRTLGDEYRRQGYDFRVRMPDGRLVA